MPTGNHQPKSSMRSRDADLAHLRCLKAALAMAALSLAFTANTSAQTIFTNVPIAGLSGVGLPTSVWGDFDNDGRLDFLLTGVDTSGHPLSQLWQNTNGGFTNVFGTAFPDNSFAGIRFNLPYEGGFCSVAWGDYDNDGRLDLLAAGEATNNSAVVQLWRNTSSGFTNATGTVAPKLSQVDYGSLAWGDYDNDGRLDCLLTGTTNNGSVSQLWRNMGGGFTNVPIAGLPGVVASSAAWGDYDNDGRLDFILAGKDTNNVLRSQLWRNNGNGTFSNVTATAFPAGLPGVYQGSVAWGDYDNDGRLDCLLTGATNFTSAAVSQLWRNNGNGTFSNVTATAFPAGLPGVSQSFVAWGDCDNDGRLDFLLTGTTNGITTGTVSQLWRNNGDGTFSNVTAAAFPAGLPVVRGGSVAWADYDNDGRLDFLIAGSSSTGSVAQLWHNIAPVTNAPPGAPTGLAMTATTNAVMLSWNSATDDHTPASGLSYNVRAGSTPGGIDLYAGHVNAASGFRRVPAPGNAMMRHSLPLTGLTNGQTVYWSVQAVDTSFAGGPFATETSVVSIPQLAITPGTGTNTVVAWTPPTYGWHLQERTNLMVGAWSNSPSVELNPVTINATNGIKFYRLANQ